MDTTTRTSSGCGGGDNESVAHGGGENDFSVSDSLGEAANIMRKLAAAKRKLADMESKDQDNNNGDHDSHSKASSASSSGGKKRKPQKGPWNSFLHTAHVKGSDSSGSSDSSNCSTNSDDSESSDCRGTPADECNIPEVIAGRQEAEETKPGRNKARGGGDNEEKEDSKPAAKPSKSNAHAQLRKQEEEEAEETPHQPKKFVTSILTAAAQDARDHRAACAAKTGGGAAASAAAPKGSKVGCSGGSKAAGKLSSDDQRWLEQYMRLVDYYDEHGHSLVPANYKKDRSLGRWLYKQRQLYEAKRLAEDRIQLLENLNFVWVARQNAGQIHQRKWEEKLECLKRFKEEHGHAKVPLQYATDGLGAWATTQRSQKLKGILDPERERRLDELGFHWSKDYDQKWNERFRDLQAFKKKNGHCDVSRADPDTRLSRWVHYQRHAHGLNKLPPDRENKLEELGFQWEVRGEDGKSSSPHSYDDENSDNSTTTPSAKVKGNPKSPKPKKAATQLEAATGDETPHGAIGSSAGSKRSEPWSTPSSSPYAASIGRCHEDPSPPRALLGKFHDGIDPDRRDATSHAAYRPSMVDRAASDVAVASAATRPQSNISMLGSNLSPAAILLQQRFGNVSSNSPADNLLRLVQQQQQLSQQQQPLGMAGMNAVPNALQQLRERQLQQLPAVHDLGGASGATLLNQASGATLLNQASGATLLNQGDQSTLMGMNPALYAALGQSLSSPGQHFPSQFDIDLNDQLRAAVLRSLAPATSNDALLQSLPAEVLRSVVPQRFENSVRREEPTLQQPLTNTSNRGRAAGQNASPGDGAYEALDPLVQRLCFLLDQDPAAHQQGVQAFRDIIAGWISHLEQGRAASGSARGLSKGRL